MGTSGAQAYEFLDSTSREVVLREIWEPLGEVISGGISSSPRNLLLRWPIYSAEYFMSHLLGT